MSRLTPDIQQEINFINLVISEIHKQSLLDFFHKRGMWKRPEMGIVREIFLPFTDLHWLKERLPSQQRPNGRLRRGKNMVFFNFIEKDTALPLFDMRWDFRHPSSKLELRFRFFLLQWKKEGGKPHAVGFRLESSEGPGAHDYWHAQMITEFEKDDDDIRGLVELEIPAWIPTSQPAFPLPVRRGPEGIGDLLAVLLVSLYGLEELKGFKDLEGFAEVTERLRAIGVLRQSSNRVS